MDAMAMGQRHALNDYYDQDQDNDHRPESSTEVKISAASFFRE